MTVRILQLGDSHLGMAAEMEGAPAGQSRAADHLAAFDAALAPARDGQMDLVIHTGDLFDRSVPPQQAVLDAADRLVALARQVPVVVIAGNHEKNGLKKLIPHGLDTLHVVDRPTRLEVCGLRLACLPYHRHADDWAVNADRLCQGGVDAIVAHQGFDGGRVPGYTFRRPRHRDVIGSQDVPEGITHILSGHLHPRQTHPLGDALVVHAGSTERTSFSERLQPKGAVHWQWGGEPTCRFVSHPTRAMALVGTLDEAESVQPGTWVILCKGSDPDVKRRVLERGGFVRPERIRRPRRGDGVRVQAGLFETAGGAPNG